MTGTPRGLKWLFNNLGSLIIAIALAVLVWIVAEQEAYPNVERVFPTPVAIVAQNMPAGMIAYGESARTVRVTFNAPQSSLDVLTLDRIAATIDLSQQPSGTLELPVHVTVADRMVQPIKIEPAIVKLNLEPLAEVKTPVTLNVVGEPALGYKAAPVQTTPASVTLRGPASLVRQVAAVSGQISIQDARVSISQTLSLSPRTRDGQLVPYVSLTPSTTLAFVGIQQLGGFRDLAVKIDLQGIVAPGYTVANVTVNPQIVTVFGSAATLNALPGFIATQPVSVTNVTEDLDRRVRLNLPSGVSMLGDPNVEVTVKVNAIESSVTMQITPTLQGLQPGLAAELSPAAVDVILNGPISKLDTLRQNDVEVVLNLLNLGIGTYQLTPEVIVPEGFTVGSTLPAIIQATITEQPTPTATLTATVTLTTTNPLPTSTLKPKRK